MEDKIRPQVAVHNTAVSPPFNIPSPCRRTTFGSGQHTSYIRLTKQMEGISYHLDAHQVVGVRARMNEYGENFHNWSWDFQTLELSHDCHNKWCVNPRHLRLTTTVDNMERSKMPCHKYSECTICKSKHYFCQHEPPCRRVVETVCSFMPRMTYPVWPTSDRHSTAGFN